MKTENTLIDDAEAFGGIKTVEANRRILRLIGKPVHFPDLLPCYQNKIQIPLLKPDHKGRLVENWPIDTYHIPRFDLHWNWAMRAIEFIENNHNADITIVKHATEIKCYDEDNTVIGIIHGRSFAQESKVFHVFEALSHYTKWYSAQLRSVTKLQGCKKGAKNIKVG